MMAEETTAAAVTEAPATDSVATPPVKKQRAPRRPKGVAEASATSSPAASAKPGRGRRKQTEITVEATPNAEKKRGGRPAKSAAASVKASKPQPASQTPKVQAVDAIPAESIAELLELEAENQRLRQALSDKLRVENADLRKRLGLN
ncbi:hypothetical protein QA644_24985 (plasmid) [Rhizobium sp. CC1099]|uniref:hypothetical protein n=1 Tax=Rhizobium sp. CC1099 TaxID=3039160 RepID=UPI0024B12381|nr:hypothetical protein [Rhizobium sp. CC1099]WFU91416.1 hypothetical protein QA644_24985 [Rhizobium sp. CC1099]